MKYTTKKQFRHKKLHFLKQSTYKSSSNQKRKFLKKTNFYPKKRIFFQVQHYKYSIEEKFFGG